MVYELYFKEVVKEAGFEIIKYIQNLPDIKSDKYAMEQVLSIYKETNDKNSPIRNSVFFISNVPLVKEIEESFSKSK
jgi:hypothetical protein